MGKELLKSLVLKSKKRNFYSSESAIAIGNVNTDKLIISDEYP